MKEQLKKHIISIFDKYLDDNYLLFIFGSFAKGKTDRSSDLDLAVYKEPYIADSLILKLKESLENEAPTLRQIDLVNLTASTINKKLLENILKEGKIWKMPKNSRELLKNLKKRLRNLKK